MGNGGGVILLEHRRNEEIPTAMVMRRRRLEWFGHVKRRDETENILAVVEMKMERKPRRGRPKLRWKDTVRRDPKAWNIREEWATDRERLRSLQDPLPRTGRRRRKGRNYMEPIQDLLLTTYTYVLYFSPIFIKPVV